MSARGLAAAVAWLGAAVLVGAGCAPGDGSAPTTARGLATSTTTAGTAATTSAGTTLGTSTSSSVPSTTATSAPATSTTGSTLPAWWREVTPDAALQVWVIGDSLAGPVGSALAFLGRDSGLVRAMVTFQEGTGLARPDVFLWPAVVEDESPGVALDVIVVLLGANDGQGIESAQGWVAFGTPEWDAQYGTLVGSFISQLLSHAGRVYWVGPPIMADPGYDSRMRHLSGLVEAEVAGRPEAGYIDACRLFQGEDGAYAAVLPDADGTPVEVRAGDGIHYTRAGAERLARYVLEVLAADWEMDAG